MNTENPTTSGARSDRELMDRTAVPGGDAPYQTERTWCPECKEQKPRSTDDLHDVVLMRMDWRKAGRPERTHISIPIGQSPMCLECSGKIAIEFGPLAPTFDKRGNRCNAEVAR